MCILHEYYSCYIPFCQINYCFFKFHISSKFDFFIGVDMVMRLRNPPVNNMIMPMNIIMLLTARGFRVTSIFLKRNGDRAVVNVKTYFLQ